MRNQGWITKFNTLENVTDDLHQKRFVLPDERVSPTFFSEIEVYPNTKEIETLVRDYWARNKTPEKYLTFNNNKKEKFSFFDGPITANNPMGVHHAWGRTLKDVVLRYKTRSGEGKNLRYQNGFDTQGLWVEVEVEKALGIKNKRELLDFGLDKFTEACKERVKKYGQVISEQSSLLGQWMDWKNSYWTHNDKNIEAIWEFLKVCHDKNWLYKDEQVMPWCPRCSSSLSQHEQSDSYRDFVHNSLFVRFKVKTPSKNLLKLQNGFNSSLNVLVWTTTPWTLPANVAVAFNPESTYLLVKNEVDEFLLVGEVAFDKLKWLKKSFAPVESLNGQDLSGTVLENLTESFVPSQSEVTVKLIPWSKVADTDGSGFVHVAPGCGPEDYTLGKELNLPFLSPLDEYGNYKHGFGFDNEFYKTVNDKVKKKLNLLGYVVKDTKLKHRYPVCWRCKEELVYRLVPEWFISVDEIRPALLKSLDKIKWDPKSLKARMKNWLENMGDWCISRKRFWGLPLPFYECSCGHLQVFGNVASLAISAGLSSVEDFFELVKDLHRPYVDSVKVKCSNCNEQVERVPEVGDCWLDAGIMPYSTLKYFRGDKEKTTWKQWFPADFVVEMREQVRLWFYSMLFLSVTLTGEVPFRFVKAHERVTDEKGKAFSKSSYVVDWKLAEQTLGSDVNRFYFSGWDPSRQLLYGFSNAEKFFNTYFRPFWSCARFLHQNLLLTPQVWSKLDQPLSLNSNFDNLDLWLVHELNKFQQKMHSLYNEYKLESVVDEFYKFWDKTSTFYLRNQKSTFWNVKKKSENTASHITNSYHVLFSAIKESVYLIAPIVPHIAEYLHQVLLRPFLSNLATSVHLINFGYQKGLKLTSTQKSVLRAVDDVLLVVEASRKLRNEAKLKVRYVLPSLHLVSAEKSTSVLESWEKFLKSEVNVEKVSFRKPNIKNVKFYSVRPGLDMYLRLEVSKTYKNKWYQAEIFRTVQFMRKKSKLKLEQKVLVFFEFDKKFTSKFNQIVNKKFKNYLEEEAFTEIVSIASYQELKLLGEAKVKGLEFPLKLQLLS